MPDLKIIPWSSEEQWLAARREYLTATDVARLANGGAMMQATIKDEKLGVTEPFQGNKYTRWGKLREPVIMQHVEFLYGIKPNRDLYVRGKDAATPDGVGDVSLAEVKTTVTDWWQGTPDATLQRIREVKPEYYDQVQWAMWVCGRERVVFAWEPHTDFLPSRVRMISIGYDADRVTELVAVRDRFTEFMAAHTDEWVFTKLMKQYAAAQQKLVAAQNEVDEVKAEMRRFAGDRDLAVKTRYGSVSYARPKPRTIFDQTRFKTEHPELFDQYSRLTESDDPVLRVTVKHNQ